MNSRSMLRRLNRLFPPPDPEKRALAEAREFLKFATHQEQEELSLLFDGERERITSWEQLAEEDQQRVALVLNAIAHRQARGVKPSCEERLPPWLHWRARALARLDSID
jgi:hypothetical protein